MSRSNYSDDLDNWALIRWRGAVTSAMRGKRGQAFLTELRDALDAMPQRSLIADDFAVDGEFCALAVVGAQRGLDMSGFNGDWADPADIGNTLGIPRALAAEVMYENDESVSDERCVYFEVCGPVRPQYPDWGRHQRSMVVPDPSAGARRWSYMRDWVERQLKATAAQPTQPAQSTQAQP